MNITGKASIYVDDKHTAKVYRCSNAEWTTVMNEFEDSSFYQTYAYGSVVYGDDNIEHILMKDANGLLAAAQVGIRHFPYLKTGTANIHWGPLWIKRHQQGDIRHFTSIITAIKSEYAVRRKLLVRLWPNIIDDRHAACKTHLTEKGYIHNPEERPYRTLRLDISPSLDELTKNFDQKWRNQLNKAKKNNLTIIEGTDDHFYSIFLNLQKEMIDRKHYIPGVDYDEYGKIQNRLSDEQKMKIFVCEAEGKAVAVSMCSCTGGTGIYLLGATGDDGMKLNGSNLLQWHMIQTLKENGCRFYDLGGIDPNTNPGVYRFKCGVVGKSGEDISHIGQYYYSSTTRAALLDLMIKKSKHIRAIIKNTRNR